MHWYLKSDRPANKSDMIELKLCLEQNEKIQTIYRSHYDANITDGAIIEKVIRE